MKALQFFLFLFAALRCILSQVQLQESEPGLVKPSETLFLTCSVSGISITTNPYCWNWIRQTPGEGLQWLSVICYNGGTDYAPSLKSRLSTSRDTSKNQFSMQLISMTAEDMAVYYCAREGGTGWNFDVWGSGTMVTVSSENPSAPNLFPLLSCGSSLPQDSLMAMGCLARDFLPSSITFSWNYKNDSKISNQNFMTFPSTLRDGKYMASSQLLLPSANVVPGTDEYLVCKVQHTKGEVMLSVPLSELLPPELPPNLTVYIPPRDAFASLNQRTSKLICEATDFSPRTISVSWLRDGKLLETGFSTDEVKPEAKVPGPITYKITSMLTISESDWLSQSVFTCRVEHNGMIFQKNVSSICSSGSTIPIKIFPIPPSFAGIFLTKSAKLSCMVTDLTTYDSLSISWTRQNGEVLKTHTNISESFPNATFSAMGEATVCMEDWETGDEFTCTVTHTDLPSPLKRTISKAKGVPKHMPAVYLLPPTREELSLRESVSITCLVKNFSPPDVFVQWLHKGQPMPKDKYVTSAAMPEPQAAGLYFAYSILNVSEEDWLNGETYTCVVGHEALPHIVTERTVDKSTGKPSVYNVSLVLSDTANTCY